MTTKLDNDTLEWAAQWIQDSLKGETNERVIQFGNNMAMTLRAAVQPAASTPTEPQISFGPEPTTVGQKQVVIHDYGDRKVYTSQPPKPFEADSPPTSEAARAYGLRRIKRKHYDPEARNLPTAASTETQDDDE